MARKKDLWRHTEGRRGINLVTVYERYPGSRLYIEWWTRSGNELKRHQRSLRTAITQEPVLDKKLAIAIAVEVSQKQALQHKQRGYREVFGTEVEHVKFKTLGDLLEQLHSDLGAGWTPAYRRDQERYKRFWLEALGEGTRLHSVNPAMVEQVVRDEVQRRVEALKGDGEGKLRQWSPRQQQAVLKYIVSAFNYAQEKLRWLEPKHLLQGAVTLPKPKRGSEAFTTTELRRLLPALEEVDERAGWIGRVLLQTGRRVSATAKLLKADVEMHTQYSVLRYPEHAENKRGGEALITGRAHELLQRLMQRPGRYVLGTHPPRTDELRRWMDDAMAAVSIEKRRWLGWHSIKRRFAGATEGAKGRSAQSGTSERTLREVYDPQDDREDKLRVAEQMEQEIEG